MNGFFIDIQGTLIDDKNHLPLPGSVEFLDYLNSKNIPFILITNNTKRDSVEFQNYLKNLGFKFENYLDPLMVLDDYVKDKKIAPFGNDKFLELMQKYEIDYKNPESVVLGLKLFSNDEIAEIIEKLLKGSELIGMHKTSLYHKNNKRYPGLGAILEMLKYATGREYVTVGKPSVSFFQKASEILGVNFDKITIISDDLKGDLLPAKNLNMRSVLVLSGKIKSPEEITQNPDFIFENLDDLLRNRRDNGR